MPIWRERPVVGLCCPCNLQVSDARASNASVCSVSRVRCCQPRWLTQALTAALQSCHHHPRPGAMAPVRRGCCLRLQVQNSFWLQDVKGRKLKTAQAELVAERLQDFVVYCTPNDAIMQESRFTSGPVTISAPTRLVAEQPSAAAAAVPHAHRINLLSALLPPVSYCYAWLPSPLCALAVRHVETRCRRPVDRPCRQQRGP